MKNKPTLLSKATGGKYKTSKDLPPINKQLTTVMELLGTPAKAEEPSLVNLALALPFIPGPIKKGMRSTIKNMKKWRDVPMSRKVDIDEWTSGQWTPKKSIQEGKEWIEEWYNTYRGPEIEKIKSTMKFQRDGSKTVDGKDYFEFAGKKIKSVHSPNSPYYNINKGPISLRDVAVAFEKEVPGVAGRYRFRNPTKYSKEYGMPIGGINKITINKDFLNYDILRDQAIKSNLTHKQYLKSLAIHEYGHALNYSGDHTMGVATTMINNARSISRLAEGARVAPGAMYRNTLGKLEKTSRTNHKYLKSPQEIYRRIDQLRFELGEDPTRLTKQFVKLRNMEGQSVPYTNLRRVLNHEQIEKLYNKLPALLPFGFAPAFKGKNDKNRKY